MKKKKLDAFVTIEYTLLLPVFMMLYTVLIYIALFLYNQCVLQTNVYLLGMEGACFTARNATQTIDWLQNKEKHLYNQKYLLAEGLEMRYRVQGNQIEITGSGHMPNPLSAVGLGEEMWDLNAYSKATVISPVNILRLCEKARELLQNVSIEKELTDDS